MSPHIAIVDYKMGNLRSVQKGFEHAGVEDVVVTGDPALIEAADGIVLPGVGAFRDAVANLRESGVEEVLRHKVGGGTPFLGICLGLQLLADMGYEDGDRSAITSGLASPKASTSPASASGSTGRT